MKKAAAILVSVFLYIGAFLLMFRLSMGDQIRWFLFGFPVMTAMYFVIAGNLFARYLHLNRWSLWLSMNLIGGLCSVIILLICFPTLLMNGMILFLIGPLVGVFVVVWTGRGAWISLREGSERTSRSARRDGGSRYFPPSAIRCRGWKVKESNFVVGLLLLILAASSLYVGARGFASIRPCCRL